MPQVLRTLTRGLGLLLGGLALATSAAADPAARAPVSPAPAQPTKPASYVAKKPAPDTQVQKTAAARGVNPCDTPDPGFGIYDKWRGGIGMGQFIMPKHGGITPRGDFDVMIHFHGHEAVRKEWV